MTRLKRKEYPLASMTASRAGNKARRRETQDRPQKSMIASTVGKRGEVVIPEEIRERLRIRAGNTIIFRVEAGRVLIETHMSRVLIGIDGERMKDILKAGRPVCRSVEFQRGLRAEWT